MDKGIFDEPWVAKCLGVLVSQAPAFAGAVLSLAFIGRLSPAGRIVAVVVGIVTAMFIAPAISELIGIFWPAERLPEAVSKAVQFMVSLSAMGALPELLSAIRRASGDPLGMIERFLPAKKSDGEGNA